VSRPSFQFYPKDWRNNANLRRCSPAARGAWMDVMCVLHDSDEYGLVRWPLKELANAAGVSIGLARELVDKSVLKGNDKTLDAALVYTPRSGRREGPPVTLVPVQDGPVWFSSRMVKDEYVRTIRGEGTRFTEDNQPSPKPGANRAPNPPFGDGPSSSSSSSSSTAVTSSSNSTGSSPPPAGDGLLTPPEPETPGIPACDHQAVLALWQQAMPTNPQPAKWTETRRRHLQARWRELFAEGKAKTRDEALAWFGKFFRYLAKSPFLTGRVPARDANRPPFVAELPWVLSPEHFVQCIEGKYHPET
jgi:hypothetical protein